MSKFLNNITASNADLKRKRASQLETFAKIEKKSILDALSMRREKVLYEIDRLYDLSPKHTTDLAYRDDFDPKKWAEETSTLEIELMTLEMKIRTLATSYEEWFGREKKEGE
jgi:hypothetical protein